MTSKTTSTIPPAPGEPKRDMVLELAQTRQGLKEMRFNLARACEDLEMARENAIFKKRAPRGPSSSAGPVAQLSLVRGL
ncbi:MAG TPA: hypothetical protein VJN18_11150 [Polyangiaceae bacterium]|nr:hypothetical protein [Polyangiaceae bacterium]